MAKKEKKQPAGAPGWIVTYGDMMSLLLCFFVILVAMSEIKQDEKFQEVMESIKIAFGYQGGIGATPTTIPPKISLVKRLESIVIPKRIKQIGDADDVGIEGKVFRITQVREGIKVAVGGRVSFGRFSAALKPEGADLIAQLADKIRGHTNKIDVRGHATLESLPSDSPYEDQVDLSFARARAVAKALVDNGVNDKRIRITACGATELLLRQAYDEKRRSVNRRAEIIVSESLISEYEGEPVADTETAQNG